MKRHKHYTPVNTVSDGCLRDDLCFTDKIIYKKDQKDDYEILENGFLPREGNMIVVLQLDIFFNIQDKIKNFKK